MPDNTAIKDGLNAAVTVATDELSDSSQSPKVTVLSGDSTPTPLPLGTLLGTKTTAVTALGAGGSGIIGWLSQVWDVLQSGAVGAKVTAVTALGAGGAGVVGWLSTIADALLNTGVKLGAGTAAIGFTQVATTIMVTITRPNDTNAYAVNDCWADSTSAPTAGGYTVAGAARVSGGAGQISDMVIISSGDPATTLQGEVWIFDSAATAVNDNAAFDLSDADVIKLVTVVPFTLNTSKAGTGTNSVAIIVGPICDFQCVGSANLRYLVKVKNAYVPIAQEQLSIRFKIRQLS